MPRRKQRVVNTKGPYNDSPHHICTYELLWTNPRTNKEKVITNGESIKFKRMRGTYKFMRLVHHEPTGKTWIDCMSDERGSFHSYEINKLKGPAPKKRSRKKKDE